ncbi:hypothetical protein [Neobacillus niacini]|uniref:hypothetical protein n=1 Tax=Neobacillus niacini TaxID=86668 RepID=UPI00203E4F2E|nr:hypothetical protein [Neobacillus niacini]MCM3691905.1 hypothetical protein [Neobacillus niacini]
MLFIIGMKDKSRNGSKTFVFHHGDDGQIPVRKQYIYQLYCNTIMYCTFRTSIWTIQIESPVLIPEIQ